MPKNPQKSNTTTSNKKSVKSNLKTKLETDQLNLIYNKLQNNQPLNHQDSTVIAQHYPSLPGFEHLKPEADLKSKGRLRFDQIVKKAQDGTATKYDYWEIGNSNLYDWDIDELGLKNNDHTQSHPKNPLYKKSQEEEQDKKDKEKATKKKESKITNLKNKRENYTKKMETAYTDFVESPLKELEDLETQQGWVEGLGNLYTVSVSNEGIISIKFNQPEVSILMESDTYKSLSDDARKKAKKIYGENNHLIKKKIAEINKNLYKYNSLKKSYNTVNSDLIDMGIFD